MMAIRPSRRALVDLLCSTKQTKKMKDGRLGVLVDCHQLLDRFSRFRHDHILYARREPEEHDGGRNSQAAADDDCKIQCDQGIR